MKLFLKLFFALLALGFVGACEPQDNGENVIYRAESPYHHIKVVEREDGHYRDLIFGRLLQATMQDNDPTLLVYPYARSAFLGLTMVPKVERALFIGMGAGTLSNVMRQLYPEAEIDIVDIDPFVFDVAKRYFHFHTDDKTRTVTEDGRVYLRNTERRYDLIVIDTFNEEGVPFHLTTREFLEITRSRLTAQGCLVSHFWGRDYNRFFDANIRTHQEVFGDAYLLEADHQGDFILLAPATQKSFDKGQIVARARQLSAERAFGFDLVQIAEHEFNGSRPLAPAATVLTDDYAPVNLMRYQEAR